VEGRAWWGKKMERLGSQRGVADQAHGGLRTDAAAVVGVGLRRKNGRSKNPGDRQETATSGHST